MRLQSAYDLFLFIALFIVSHPSIVTLRSPQQKPFFEIGVENARNVEYSEAIDAFKHAIKLNPDYAEAYFNLGHSILQPAQI